MKQQGFSNRNKNAHKFLRTFLVLTAALLFFAACANLGQGASLGDQVQLQPQTEAVLTCSQECADRGQCGTLPDQSVVVLGGLTRPTTAAHDVYLMDGSRVGINIMNITTLEVVATGEQPQIPFYNVTSFDQGKSAWVAGWCIAAP